MPPQSSPPSSPPREVAADPHSHPVDVDGLPQSTPPPTIDLTDDADSPSHTEEDNDEDNDEDNEEENDEDPDEDHDEDHDEDDDHEKIEEAEADEADVDDDIVADDDGDDDVDTGEDEVDEQVDVEDDIESEPSVEELEEGENDTHQNDQNDDDEESTEDRDMDDDIQKKEIQDDHPASPAQVDVPDSMEEDVNDVHRINQLKDTSSEEQAMQIQDPIVIVDSPQIESQDDAGSDTGSAAPGALEEIPHVMNVEKYFSEDMDVKASAETESVSLVGSHSESADAMVKGYSIDAASAVLAEERGGDNAVVSGAPETNEEMPHPVDEKSDPTPFQPAESAIEETEDNEKSVGQDTESDHELERDALSKMEDPAELATHSVKSDDLSQPHGMDATSSDKGATTESREDSGDAMDVINAKSPESGDQPTEDDKTGASADSADGAAPKTSEIQGSVVFNAAGGSENVTRHLSVVHSPQNGTSIAKDSTGPGEHSVAEKIDVTNKQPPSGSDLGKIGIPNTGTSAFNAKFSLDKDVTMTPAPRSPPKTPGDKEQAANITSPMFGVQPTSRTGPVKFSSPPSFHRPALNPAAKPFIPSSSQATTPSSSNQLKLPSADRESKGSFGTAQAEDRAAEQKAPSETPPFRIPVDTMKEQTDNTAKLSFASSESQDKPAQVPSKSAETEREEPVKTPATSTQPQEPAASQPESQMESQGTAQKPESGGFDRLEESATGRPAVFAQAQAPETKSGIVAASHPRAQLETPASEMPDSEEQKSSGSKNRDSPRSMEQTLSTGTSTPPLQNSQTPDICPAVQPPTHPQPQTPAKEAEVPSDHLKKTPSDALAATGDSKKQRDSGTPGSKVSQLSGNLTDPARKRDDSEPSSLPLRPKSSSVIAARSVTKQSARGRGNVEQILRRIPAKGTSGGMTYCVENVSVAVKHGAGKPIRRSDLCTIELMTIPNGESKMDFSDSRTVPKNVWLSLSSTKDTVKIMKVINKPFIMSITVLGPSKKENSHDSTKYFIHLRQNTFQVFYDACLKFILDFVAEKGRPPVVKFSEPVNQEHRASNASAASPSTNRTRVGLQTPVKRDSENQKENQKKLLQQKLAALQKKKAERTAEASTQRAASGAGKGNDRSSEKLSAGSQPEKLSFRHHAQPGTPASTPSGLPHAESRGFRGNTSSAIPSGPLKTCVSLTRGHAQPATPSSSGHGEKQPSQGHAPPTTTSVPSRIPTGVQKSTRAQTAVAIPYTRSANPEAAGEDAQKASTKVSDAVGKSPGPGSKTMALHERPVDESTAKPDVPMAMVSTPTQRLVGSASAAMQKGLMPPTSPKKRPAFRAEEGGDHAAKRARYNMPWRPASTEDGERAVVDRDAGLGTVNEPAPGIGSRLAQFGTNRVGTRMFGSVGKSATPAGGVGQKVSLMEEEMERLENDSRKLKSLLTAMKSLVAEGEKEKVVEEEEGSLERCDVKNRADFFKRLHTFKPMTWMMDGRDHALSPVECARRGWYNSAAGRLRSNEGGEIVTRFQECKTFADWNTEEERVKRFVEGGEGHVLLSEWRKEICSEEFGKQRREGSVKELAEQWKNGGGVKILEKFGWKGSSEELAVHNWKGSQLGCGALKLRCGWCGRTMVLMEEVGGRFDPAGCHYEFCLYKKKKTGGVAMNRKALEEERGNVMADV